MIVTPSASSNDKRNILLSSGDYPEIFVSGNFNNGDLMKYGAQEKILIPMNQYIDKYGVEVKRLWGIMKYLKSDMTAPDGNIYALPYIDEGKHGAISNKMWINTDWLKKLGLQMPTTTDEFKNVLMAFKTKDPNGNGKNDEIPMSGAVNTWAADPQLFLLNSFLFTDQTHNYLSLDSRNNLVFAANKTEFKEGLRFVQDLFKSGLIDPSAFTQNEQQLAQLGNKPEEVLGAFGAGHIAMAIDINNKERQQHYDVLLPLKGPNGFVTTPYATPGRVSGGTFAITSKCKNPDIAYRIGDILYNEQIGTMKNYGRQGQEWDLADAGTLGVTGQPAKYKFLKSANQNNDPTNYAWRWESSPTDLTDAYRGLWASSQDLYSPDGYIARLYQCIDKYMPFVGVNPELPPLYVDSDTSVKLDQSWTNIKSYIDTSVVQFITGKKDVDKDWDSYVQGYEKLKLQDYMDTYKKSIGSDDGRKEIVLKNK